MANVIYFIVDDLDKYRVGSCVLNSFFFLNRNSIINRNKKCFFLCLQNYYKKKLEEMENFIPTKLVHFNTDSFVLVCFKVYSLI